MNPATPIRFAILTASDRSARGERLDESGPALAELVKLQGWTVVHQEILPDDETAIKEWLIQWSDGDRIDVLLVSGGTGFAPRDVTPEATLAVVHRRTPGLDEAMRRASMEKTPHAMLSRSVSGIRGKTLIVTLPGSPRGATENLQVLIPALEHAVRLLREEQTAH